MPILDYSRGLTAAGPQTTLQRTLGTTGMMQGLQQNQQVMEQQAEQQQAQQAQLEQQGRARVKGAELLKSGTPDEIAEFGMLNPEVMKDFISNAQFKDQQAIGSRVQYAQNILSGNVNPREAIEARVREVEMSGGDASGLRTTMALSDEDIVKAAEKDLAVISPKAFASYRKATGQDDSLEGKPSAVQETEWFNKQSPEIQETHLKIKRGEKPTLDQKLDYEKSKAEIKEDTAVNTARKKTADQRRQGYIDSGVSSADNLHAVNRSLDLMNSIKTGGIDAALLQAKQTLGIESADEAELTYELGKSVLKQLKPTFGAAFTVNEMLELKRMEAGLGKSVAGNKRILNNLAKVIERSANRGMRAAKSLGDEFAANEIELAISGGSTKPLVEPSAGNADVPDMSDEEMLKMYGGQ